MDVKRHPLDAPDDDRSFLALLSPRRIVERTLCRTRRAFREHRDIPSFPRNEAFLVFNSESRRNLLKSTVDRLHTLANYYYFEILPFFLSYLCLFLYVYYIHIALSLCLSFRKHTLSIREARSAHTRSALRRDFIRVQLSNFGTPEGEWIFAVQIEGFLRKARA